MGELVDEVKLWNTPLIGAFLLWRFTQGYCKNHLYGDAPIGLLHFIASAILTSKRLSEPITDRRENLQSYTKSFEDKKDYDVILTVHDRIIEKREYTLAAIDIAIKNGLIMFDVSSGKIYAKELPEKGNFGKKVKDVIKAEGKKAEILGKWFSQHDLFSITAYLKVVL